MSGKPFRGLILPLAKQHDRRDFSCGNENLDRYLRELAWQDARRRVAAPFVAVSDADSTKIRGYYTLSSYSVNAGELPDKLAKRLPAYPRIPSTLLGRLAVDLRHQRQGLGEFLIMDALQRALEQSSQIAAVAVVVDAIDEQAARFYQHFDFLSLPDRPNRLFLPMSDISDLFK
jgi:GNAT superfamily N-acetyltransferase